MADNEDTKLPTEGGNNNLLLRIAVGVVALLAVYFIFFSGDSSEVKAELDRLRAEAKQNAKTKDNEKALLHGNQAAIDISAAFKEYNDSQSLITDKVSKIGDQQSRIEVDIESKFKALRDEIKKDGYDNKIQMDNLLEEFRKYQDTNNSAYLEGGVEVGGIVFDEGDSQVSGQNDARPKTKKLRSNFIPLFTGLQQTANDTRSAASEGADSVAAALGFESKDKESDKKSSKTKKDENMITVPAQSWVDADTFHGLRCPIINGIATVAGSTNAAPVTMKVRGLFHGPNGDIIDIGPVHISATCEGVRTGDDEYGVANISLKKLSYSIGGNKDDIKIEGYVLDLENKEYLNMPGLRGPIDAVQATTLADSALAAAISVASFGFKGTQTSTFVDAATGNERSEFDGNVATEILTQGIGGYFMDMYDSFKALKDTAVDAVLTKSGSKIRIFVNGSFDVPKQNISEDFFFDDEEESYL